MATGTDIPVTVTDEARAWIADLGMQREFEMMLEHTLQTVSGLNAIQVKLEHDPSGAIEPQIVIWCYRENKGGEEYEYDPTDWDWGTWKIETFPPEVCLNFVMLSTDGVPDHGR
jgi:hypothetical protein